MGLSGEAVREGLARTLHDLIEDADPREGCDHSRELMRPWQCRAWADRALAAIPASDNEGLRLIDTKPEIGALTADIETELDSHNPGANWECDCGDQMDGETYNRHVASMVDYRLTATDGDA